MACWYYKTNTATGGLLSTGDIDNSNVLWSLYLKAAAIGGEVRFRANTADASTTLDWSQDTWEHAAAVGTSATDRAVFINGGNKGISTTDITPTGLDKTALAVERTNILANYLDGRMADATVWDVALSDAEVAIPALGFSPLLVRPANLVAYWPLIRDDRDWVGGYDMTAYNSPTWAAHAGKVKYPLWRPSLLRPGAAALLLRRGVLRGIARGILRGV